MDKKKLTLLIIVLVVILAMILLTVWTQNPSSTASNSGAVASNTANSQPTSGAQATHSVTSTGAPSAIVVSPLTAFPGSPEAPKQVVIEASKIPTTAVKLTVSDDGFSPKEFTLKAGQQVSLAITATGSNSHVFIFPTASLTGLTSMITGGETKVITFTAPDAGSYSFRDDIPTFRANTGTMIVQ